MKQETEVLYNGSCPICSREVVHYARLTERQALAIRYDDLADSDRLAAWGIAPDEAAKRLHVRKDGQTYAGVPAFLVLWRDIPQMRWLARIVETPGVHRLACMTYDHVLAPVLYRMHLRRMRRRS
ncbi:DUF393 domain-containing protein [Sulfitobacter sp. HNIBRBA3233]|uniref:thiol-disulfide oxidoreductase DCC family protein n=1 Tax=Sulfitobacter marinivivus TaxID=3158558 RepID=UPI0032E03788